MSNIQQIKPKYEARDLSTGKVNYASKQSFGKMSLPRPKVIGKYEGLDELSREVAKDTERKKIGWGTWLGEKLAIKDSEIEKQLINAAFTSTLAPVMIGFNPFSNQDDNTKKYMAMRQPISAVIAVGGAAPLTMMIENWLAGVFSEGRVPSLDMRIAPDKSYLKKQLKNEHNLKGIILNRQERKARKEKINTLIKDEQERIKTFFTELISTDPKKIGLNEKGEISITREGQEPLTKKIPNITSQAELNDYLSKNNLHEKTFGDLLKENLGFEFYEDGKIKTTSTKTKLKNTSAIDFLRSIGIKDIDETKLKKETAVIRENSITVSQYQDAYENCDPKAKPDFKKLAGANGQQATTIVETHLGEAAKEETSTMSQLFHRFGYEGDNLQELMNTKAGKAIESIQEHLKNIPTSDTIEKSGQKVTGTLEHKKLSDFAKNMIGDKAGRLEKQFSRAYKGYFSIISNLVIVAITCTILNWVYPRFMDKFFPHLSKSESPSNEKKGGIK